MQRGRPCARPLSRDRAYAFASPSGFGNALRLAHPADSLVRVSRRVDRATAQLNRENAQRPRPPPLHAGARQARDRIALPAAPAGRQQAKNTEHPSDGALASIAPTGCNSPAAEATEGTFPPTLSSRAHPSGRGPHTTRSAPPRRRIRHRRWPSQVTPASLPSSTGHSSAAAESRRGTPRRPDRFLSERFHVLLNSLFKVLFNVPSRYLFAIGLAIVFSLRRSLPPALGCILKQPDS